MDMTQFFLSATIFLFLLIFFTLLQFLRQLIKKQIDDQLTKMIPLKAIRKRVAIKIKWKN